jgi:hypothetical protein
MHGVDGRSADGEAEQIGVLVTVPRRLLSVTWFRKDFLAVVRGASRLASHSLSAGCCGHGRAESGDSAAPRAALSRRSCGEVDSLASAVAIHTAWTTTTGSSLGQLLRRQIRLLRWVYSPELTRVTLRERLGIWDRFRSWLRTMNPLLPLSELVVAHALRSDPRPISRRSAPRPRTGETPGPPYGPDDDGAARAAPAA